MLTKINNEQTMSSLEIAELVESRHDSVKRTIERLVDKGVIQKPPTVIVEKINGLGLSQMSEHYVFTVEHKRDSFIVVAQLSPEFTARIVDRWQELESQSSPVKQLPTDYISALEALLESKKAEQIAIATKAEIGSRREATAMNKASQAMKKVKKLQIELDKSTEYSSIKRMEIITGKKYNWRVLKQLSTSLGFPAIDIPDQNYGTIKSYHAKVWAAAYDLAINFDS